jgi:EmrB/QacA subfamily drug resistance transporter
VTEAGGGLGAQSRTVRRWTLVATILGSGVVFLDSTVVNVALPAIGRNLNTGLSGLQWIVDGYVLTLAALLILGGSLGDRYGRRRVMVMGLVGFGLASMVCGLAPSLSWLIGARLVQGVAGALLVPGSLAIIRAVFREGEERGTAVGQWSGWSGITTIIGPLLGGWLVDTLSWRWVFFINVPIIAVAVVLMITQVPESRDEQAAPHLDWAGAILATLGFGGIAYGLTEGPVVGWTSWSILVGLAGGLVALLVFGLVEARLQEPMVPLSLFRSRNFTGANLTTLGLYFALYGMAFFVIIYLQNVVGYSALEAGLVLAPTSLLMLLFSPVAGKLAGRYGPRLFMSLGPFVSGLGMLAFVRLQPDSNYVTVLLPAVGLFGLGLVCTVAPLTDTVISSVPDRRSGVAAALNNAVSRIAALLAVAGLGVVVTLTFSTALVDKTANLNLSPAAQAALAQVAQDPTGSAGSALSPEVRAAVSQSYTVAFHRAIEVAAIMAWAGGLVAALIIRNPVRRKQEPPGDGAQDSSAVKADS